MKVTLEVWVVGYMHCRILVFFASVKDWLQAVAPHLVLTGFIEIIKTALSSSHPVVTLACKRCSR